MDCTACGGRCFCGPEGQAGITEGGSARARSHTCERPVVLPREAEGAELRAGLRGVPAFVRNRRKALEASSEESDDALGREGRQKPDTRARRRTEARWTYRYV